MNSWTKMYILYEAGEYTGETNKYTIRIFKFLGTLPIEKRTELINKMDELREYQEKIIGFLAVLFAIFGAVMGGAFGYFFGMMNNL